VGDRIRIHRGCDFHLHFDNIQSCLSNSAPYTINGKRYLMVEFANQKVPKSISEVFSEMLRRGITPVITHPERNRLLMEGMPQLIAWVRLGCLIQVTADSFLGNFGKPAESACRQLMAQKLVHFAASDAHDTMHRSPDMRDAYNLVASEYGEESARRFFTTNPKATLTGEDIECEDPEEFPRTRSWYRFW
jgi:protein-tyrosine phosphatase